MRLHYFNPENDILLAHAPGSRITMNRNVQALHEAGALLPIWYADPGDLVLASDAEEWAGRMNNIFSLDVRTTDSIHEANGVGENCMGEPWGWSAQAARELSEAGATTIDDERIRLIRETSHRRTSVLINNKLAESIHNIPYIPTIAQSMDDVGAALNRWGAVYVKMPWSSSGRGVMRIDGLNAHTRERIDGLNAHTRERIEGMIRRQGCVMVERALTGRQDFSMLFRCREGRVVFQGYSVFENVGTAYKGNLVAPQGHLLKHLIAQGADEQALDAIRERLEDILTDLVGAFYEGYMGVDMLLTADARIAPCLELNLRMTMGVVALRLERLLAAGCTARFTLAKSPQNNPPIIHGGRLVSGTLPLTPPHASGLQFTLTV